MPPPVPTTPGGSPAGIATTLRDAPAQGRSMGLLRPDLGPVLAGEGREGRQVGLGVDQHPGDSEGNGSLKVLMTCWYWAATAS